MTEHEAEGEEIYLEMPVALDVIATALGIDRRGLSIVGFDLASNEVGDIVFLVEPDPETCWEIEQLPEEARPTRLALHGDIEAHWHLEGYTVIVDRKE